MKTIIDAVSSNGSALKCFCIWGRSPGATRRSPADQGLDTVLQKFQASGRTFISALIDEGVNLNTVRKTAGHSSEKTALKNYTFNRGTEQQKTNKKDTDPAARTSAKSVPSVHPQGLEPWTP